MTNRHIRLAKLRDLPRLHRLSEHGVVLDSELGCTDTPDTNALLSSVILPPRGLHTFVGRVGDEQVAGQFRLKPSESLAQIVYLAPHLPDDADDTAWLHLLDALAAEAGRRGAHMLSGEVHEASRLFQTMRTAGFAVYARQEVWRREPASVPAEAARAELSAETDADAMDIQLLYCNIVPRLVQPIAVPPADAAGFVYRQPGSDRIMGYVAMSEGRQGVYLLPYLHPDVLFSEAAAILAAALTHCKADRLPVYICVRRYQDWLEEALIGLGFSPGAQQAVMVRHIAAGVRTAAFQPLERQFSKALITPVRPPTSHLNIQP